MDLNSTIKLNSGVRMPVMGLGTYQSAPGKDTYDAVRIALKAGYRLIDTAALYANEADVGKAVRDSGIRRDKIFVTTKLRVQDHGFNRAKRAFQDSLERSGLEYFDLYLIHWPVPVLRKRSWKALEELLDEGKARAIGISNYTIKHIKEMEGKTRVVPAVNQVEFSPFLYQEDLYEYCRELGIAIQAYSPLTQTKRFDDNVLIDIASRHRKTSAQVMIRWSLQKGCLPIPKSVHESRIKENADVFGFSLSEKEMEKLDSLDDDYRVCWNPEQMP